MKDCISTKCYCWYAFYPPWIFYSITVIRKNGLICLTEQPEMLEVETGNYIKGMHNLMGAHFDLLNP